ncbi:MAG: hypothetical protein F6K10_07865 [Moorea sp. SIO2B7]|nr:hypothetical protein [Moorena sp. SIO2B7]
MRRFRVWSLLFLSILFSLGGNKANALPGQLTETVAAWIAANPTLRPAIGDGLLVRKTDTAARRFTFQASAIPAGRVSSPVNPRIIRTESFSFFDMINGVTTQKLAESLRVLYGLDIYQDYQQAKLVYAYPSKQTTDLARRQNLPLLEAQRGQLRLGERYGYWMEIIQTDSGKAFNGKMTIFLKEDLDKLETELRDR